MSATLGTESVGVSVIGYGYWGPNLARNFEDVDGARVAAISDLRPERLDLARRRHPGALVTPDHSEAISAPSIDAVVIMTPVSTHHDLALQALEAGKHVLVAKPLAASVEQAERLTAEAERRGLVLLVDHTFAYTGAVRRIRELVARGELGDVYYYDAVRVNLGLFQADVNVIWDLAVHDLAILDYVCDARPRAVSALGMSHVPGKPENVAYVTLLCDQNFIAHINVSWLAPVKVRRTLIGGSEKMLVYDDLEPSEKLRVYDSGVVVKPNAVDVYEMLVDYRTGDMWSPKVSRVEALRVEAEEFVRCIRDSGRPTSDGEMGTRLVRILEAASASLSRNGELVPVSGHPASSGSTARDPAGT